MKLYLAGPMRGLPQFNFPAFNSAAARLRADGHEVFNPAEADTSSGFDPNTDLPAYLSHYMERDLPEVCRAEAIAVLPGWRNSVGAKLEVHVATVIGKPVLNAETLDPERETVLEEAERITGGDRQDQYGNPKTDFECIAAMWSAYLDKKFLSAVESRSDGDITARDVANMMVLLKIAREAHAPKRDNLVDACGYMRCAERCES